MSADTNIHLRFDDTSFDALELATKISDGMIKVITRARNRRRAIVAISVIAQLVLDLYLILK